MGIWTWLKELVADLTRPCATCGSRFHTETAHCPVHLEEVLGDPYHGGGCWSCEWELDNRRRQAQARVDAAAREAELDRLADKIAARLRGPGA